MRRPILISLVNKGVVANSREKEAKADARISFTPTKMFISRRKCAFTALGQNAPANCRFSFSGVRKKSPTSMTRRVCRSPPHGLHGPHGLCHISCEAKSK
jgi:hypothetical protein